jgi:hypothetical protein
LGYDYKILYRSGRENSATDALFHRPNNHFLNPLFVPQATLWDDKRMVAKDNLYIQQVSHQ